MTKRILLVGGSGLIGHSLLSGLLNQNVQVLLPLRDLERWRHENSTLSSHPNLTLTSYDKLWTQTPELDAFFCALGTTQAKSGKAGLMKVDHDLVIKSAEFALHAGAKIASVVSAIGANPKSVFFYNRVKGQMEKSLTALDFETIHIWQPSLLMGERPEKRFLEEFAGKFMHLSLWGNAQALPGKTVAKAMLQAFVQGTQAGVEIFNVADIKRFAAQSLKY